jgi:hypothetical protein
VSPKKGIELIDEMHGETSQGGSETVTGPDNSQAMNTSTNPDVTENPTTNPQPSPAAPETEPEPEPVPELLATFSSLAFPVKSNESSSDPNDGPQSVYAGKDSNYPGLRYGDFLLKNNLWNHWNTGYSNWYQTIALETSGDNVVGKVDWDLGTQYDLNSIYAVSSYPELIYGVKSGNEVSADQSATGLPVTVEQSPVWTIDYQYRAIARDSESSAAVNYSSVSEFNVAIETFWHASCDIQRTNNPSTDNTVFELMVWPKAGIRKPSGQTPQHSFTTSDGQVFDIYSNYDNTKYIAYVARNEQPSGTIQYSEILDDAYDNASTYGVYQLRDRDCIANIFFGPEIWHSAGTFY